MKLAVNAGLAITVAVAGLVTAASLELPIVLGAGAAGFLLCYGLGRVFGSRGIPVPERGAVVGFMDAQRQLPVVGVYGGVLVMREVGSVIDTAVAVEESQLSPNAVKVIEGLHRFLVVNGENLSRGDLSFLEKLEP